MASLAWVSWHCYAVIGGEEGVIQGADRFVHL